MLGATSVIGAARVTVAIWPFLDEDDDALSDSEVIVTIFVGP